MISMLLEDAQKHGATEISLDATPEGKLLYEKCGFKMSTENMVYRKSADRKRDASGIAHGNSCSVNIELFYKIK